MLKVVLSREQFCLYLVHYSECPQVRKLCQAPGTIVKILYLIKMGISEMITI